MRRKNLGHIRHNIVAVSIGALVAGLMSRLLWSFTDLYLIKENQGIIICYMEATFHILFALLGGVFAAATTYKRHYTKNINVTNSGKGIMGGLLGSLVAGCPSCTITLASYMGLASIMSALPRGGIEIKLIGLGLMIRSVYDTVKNIHTCAIKK